MHNKLHLVKGSAEQLEGCITIPCDMFEGPTKRIVFIADYSKLWNRYALLKLDQRIFGRYALFFEMTVNFIFGRRMIITVMLAYFNAVLTNVLIMCLQPNTVLSFGVQLFFGGCLVSAYYYFSRLYIASSSLKSEFDRHTTYSAGVMKNYVDSQVPTTWYNDIWVFLAAIFMLIGLANDVVVPVPSEASVDRDVEVDMKEVRQDVSDQLYTYHQKSGICVKTGYHNLLNIGTDFLVDHSSTIMTVNHRIRVWLLFTLVAVPILTVINCLTAAYSMTCVFGTESVNNVNFLFDLKCECQYIYTIMSGCFILPFIMFTIPMIGIMVGLIGLSFGSNLFHLMVNAWINRFASLRRMTGEMTSGACSGFEKIRPIIERDACEHYLFLQEYAKQTSDLWSPVILFILFFSLLSVVVTVLMVVLAGVDAGIISWFVVIFTLCFLYPIYTLAHANSAVSMMQHYFISGSGPNDYEILGGREVWLSHLQTSPAYWTLFGFPITWGWL